jgi:hypothetical protein
MKYLLIISIIFFISCAATKETVKEEIPEQKKAEFDESFDPMSLNDDDIIIDGQSKIEANLATADINGVNQELPFQEVDGFRVQILATDNIETASLVEQEATDRFERGGHKIYLIFEAPLYKIRVGDLKERFNAEELRDLAKQYGYKGAFIVKSKVIPSE